MNQRSRMISVIVVISVMSLVSIASAGVVAYWDFGSNGVADVSGNGHTLTNNGVTFAGGAAVFSGTQTVFNTINTLDLSACGNLTIECFVRSVSSTLNIMFEHSPDYNTYAGAFVMLFGNPVPGSCRGQFKTSAGFNIETTSAGAVSDGVWHHVAFVIDSSKTGADRAQLYLDKIRQTTYLTHTNDAATSFRNELFYIGSRSNTTYKFTGQLDDVRISDQALSTNQFLQAPTLPETVAYWPFTPGAELIDATGNGNALTNKGVVFEKGFASFGGTQTMFNTIGKLDLRWYPAVTVEYFIRTVASSIKMVLEHSINYNAYAGTFCSLADTDGSIRGHFKTPTGLNIDSTGAGVSDGVWHHVAFVIDPSKTGADRAQLYFDKRLQGTWNSYTNDGAVAFNNATLYIGSRANSDLRYSGQLDDVRVTGRVLGTNEFLRVPTTDLPQGVLAYWPFEPDAELADATGNGNVLINQGVTFRAGSAVFSGTHTLFNTVNKLDLRWYSALTIEYFVQSLSMLTNTAMELEYSQNFNLNAGAFCSSIDTAGSQRGQFKTSNNYNMETTSSEAVSDGKWHHVAIVIDSSKASADRLQLYFDKFRQAKLGAFTDDAVTSFSADILYIGSRANREMQFTGRLDDVRITGEALAPSQFMQERTVSDQGTALQVR